MSDEIFQNRYRVPSIRAEWHNYDGGIYFITICTLNREHFFGEIRKVEVSPCCGKCSSYCFEPKMFLTELGKYTDAQFRDIHDHYPYAEIPLWVVMPNHIHAIIIIHNEEIPYDRRNTAKNTKENHRDIATMQGWLSVVVGGLKRAVSHYAKEHSIPFAWQSRFYDRIIHNSKDLNNVALYIENNVVKWGNSCFHK